MKTISVWDRMGDVELDRYVLFGWHNYYPSGAYGDMKATSNNKHELKHHAYEDQYYSNWKILDMDERKWINIDSF